VGELARSGGCGRELALHSRSPQTHLQRISAVQRAVRERRTRFHTTLPSTAIRHKSGGASVPQWLSPTDTCGRPPQTAPLAQVSISDNAARSLGRMAVQSQAEIALGETPQLRRPARRLKSRATLPRCQRIIRTLPGVATCAQELKPGYTSSPHVSHPSRPPGGHPSC